MAAFEKAVVKNFLGEILKVPNSDLDQISVDSWERPVSYAIMRNLINLSLLS